VNYIVYLERFPAQDDLDLLVVAQRSPEYDIKALEAYSLIAQSLPVGVPFAENGLGDWFKSAVNFAAAQIAPALRLIPHPVAQLGANAIEVGKMTMDSFSSPPSQTYIASGGGVPDAPSLKSGTSYAPQARRIRASQSIRGPVLRGKKKKLKKVETRIGKEVLGRVVSRKRPKRSVTQMLRSVQGVQLPTF